MNNEDKYYQETSISFLDMWHNFINHFITVLIIIAVSILAFLSLSIMKGKTYSSSATIIVESGSVDNSIATKKQVMELLSNDEILEMVSKELNIEKSTFAGNISVSSGDKSTKITITYSSSNNSNIIEVVNSYVNNTVKYLDSIDNEELPVYPHLYNTTSVFSEAENVNVYSRTKKYMTFGLLLGLIAGATFVLIITMNDNHFKNRKEVENLPLPLLGEVKSYKEDK